MEKLRELGAGYGEIMAMDDDSLSNHLFPRGEQSVSKPLPDFSYLTGEMKKKGVTLQLLYEEYKRENPGGYERSQFYHLYSNWARKLDPVMRFTHKAGEKMCVDFSGDGLHYQDPATGKRIEVELFVSVLGASSYIFSCAAPDQKVESFVKCTIKAFEFYGACPECIILDNLKAGVTHACYYDPEINKTFAAMAEHYGVAVIPTRVAKPRDKAKAENAVLQAQRRIIAALRNRVFFHLTELNEAVMEEVKNLNARPMTGINKSRFDLFLEIEKPVLKPLPAERFVMAAWKKAKVHIDYHIDVVKTYYSVPYTLIGEYVDIRYTGTVVEIYHKTKRVASHMRVDKPGVFITQDLHMPHEHRHYLEWTPARIKSWGEKIGSHTRDFMEKLMENRAHPEHGFRSCLGIIRLSRTYSPQRVEKACKRALDAGAYNYRSVKNILKTGLEDTNSEDTEIKKVVTLHPNIRGGTYYQEVSHD
jgi:transposase